MTYVLGVDLGTTFTTAAVCEAGREPRMVPLGASGYAVPSVLFLREDGTFLAGEAADLRAGGDAARVARYFKRRLGDDIPIRLAGTPFAPQMLLTQLLEWVVGQATQRLGEPPVAVALTHPANWGQYRRELLEQAAEAAGVVAPLLVSEPEAAAAHYVQSQRIESGELLGVYDLGGGTFDAVIMRRTEAGFEVVGRPSGVERLGGVDFDDAIRSFVLDSVGVTALDLGETEEGAAAAHALLQSCIDAKMVLSSDTVADVRLVTPSLARTVRITRVEFEQLILPLLLETLDAFELALHSAKVEPARLSRILLVGGSSRIPVIATLMGNKFGRPLAVDSEPKNTVALGAALYARQASGIGEPQSDPIHRPATITAPVAPVAPVRPAAAAPTPLAPAVPAAPVAPPVVPTTPIGEPVAPLRVELPVQVDNSGELLAVHSASPHRTWSPPATTSGIGRAVDPDLTAPLLPVRTDHVLRKRMVLLLLMAVLVIAIVVVAS